MKTSTVPVICSFALTAMSTAGFSHWWSLRQFITALDPGVAVATSRASAAQQAFPAPPTAPLKAPARLAASKPAPPSPAPNSGQKEFYEALIAKMDGLQTQNRDLLDQLAETNRDLMKLEFRVDTHSESFRPMPVSEERRFTSVEEEPGVLPPRAEPVSFPSHE